MSWDIWSQVRKELDRELESRSLTDLLRECRESTAARSARDHLRDLCVFLRGGTTAEALAAIDRFAEAPRDGAEWQTPNPKAQLSVVANHLIATRHWGLAAHYLERVSGTGLPSRTPELLGEWRRSGKTLDEVEGWLVGRSDSPENVFELRLRLLLSENADARIQAIVAEHERAVRERPGDLQVIVAHVQLVRRVGGRVPLDWLETTVQVESPLECADLAGELGESSLAIAFLKRALARPLTIPESRRYQGCCAKRLEDPSAHFQRGVKIRLAKLLLALGQPDEAQRVLESAAAPDDVVVAEHGSLTGRAQLRSGARVFEERIRAAQADRAGNPAYWLERGSYFRGRAEWTQSFDAFANALASMTANSELGEPARGILACLDEAPDRIEPASALAVLDRILELLPGPNAHGFGHYDHERIRLVRHKAQILARAGRPAAAVAFARQQWAGAAQVGSRGCVAMMNLVIDLDPGFDFADPDLWRHLVGPPSRSPDHIEVTLECLDSLHYRSLSNEDPEFRARFTAQAVRHLMRRLIIRMKADVPRAAYLTYLRHLVQRNLVPPEERWMLHLEISAEVPPAPVERALQVLNLLDHLVEEKAHEQARELCRTYLEPLPPRQIARHAESLARCTARIGLADLSFRLLVEGVLEVDRTKPGCCTLAIRACPELKDRLARHVRALMQDEPDSEALGRLLHHIESA